MSKKKFNSEDSKPVDYLKEVEAAKQQEKINAENLIKSLRSDMHLTSDTSPEKKKFFQRINLKLIFGILLTLFILVLTWFMLSGPGRPILERNLALLVNTKTTATQTLEPSPVATNTRPPQPSRTPTQRPTTKPTRTATARLVLSPTIQPLTSTPTSASTCRDALTITLADVGQTLCVQGTVIETVERPNAFMVVFSDLPGSLYWVSYDMVWSQAELNTCYKTTGTIEQLANSPILKFGYSNIPEICP